LKNFTFILFLLVSSYANENVNTISTEEKSPIKEEELFDPLSGYNKIMTSFNDQFFMNVLNPISKGYAYITPETMRIGISNFFENIMFPVRFSNNLLQLKFKNANEELGRFTINTLWGLGGFMDPATNELNMTPHKEDFGQTLGFYGIGDGFPVVLPILGQSNLRDMVGLGADSYVSALSTTGDSDLNYKIPNNFEQELGIKSFEMINSTSLKLGQYETIRKDGTDLYPLLRDIYAKSRKKQIEE
jgi:phospholipid-binding lipoprotein MlaA